MAAVDYFLRITGVEGESADAKHKGEIDIDSWSWGASNTGTAQAGGGGGTGKVSIQDFHFVTRVSKASPRLFGACASGQHLKEARLTARKAGGSQAEFLTLTFADVLVSSYQTGGSEHSDVVPVDQVSLSFAKVMIEYRAQKADGSLDAPIKAGWDLKKNSKL
jgi:type VI secretion system secreted protein Hcp